MSNVTFETVDGFRKTSAAPDGGSLADLCDSVSAPIPFSCRSANCGTCRIVVMEGQSDLLPPSDEEMDVLDIFGAHANQRLACCAQMKPGLTTVRIRPVRDDE
jgi:2Fe-2S ferredoxin